jgi:DNA-3-methyladenine glycosylase
MKLQLDFYQQEDVEEIAKKLIGKFLVTHFGKTATCGMIVETEAYAGVNDKASHAYNGKRTKRTETMYKAGGICYIYLIYGIHALFNVVTHKEDVPHAVLIRAIEPIEGLEVMLERRGILKVKRNLCAGPGLLTQALALSTKQNGFSLTESPIWIEERGVQFDHKHILESPRVGVEYAAEDALLNRRYRLKKSNWTSNAK